MEADDIKEFSLLSRKRIYFLDINNRTIYKLKPLNPRAMKQEQKRFNMYLEGADTRNTSHKVWWQFNRSFKQIFFNTIAACPIH
ncbi:hypothetical protein [Myroides sp. TSA_177.3]|uniref:hypothetical protein n=1 Tax=Myroides sp. TSA_177.3 TaxID=3415650 RepID=UPI00404543DA